VILKLLRNMAALPGKPGAQSSKIFTGASFAGAG
jgi:hypothetical protein